MSLRGHVFNKQLFSSECFALFIDTFLGKNSGIVNGCGISNTSNSISLENGYFCIQGRFLEEQGGSTFNVEATENDTYCRLICEIDLTKTNTTGVLNQAAYKILTDNEDYPELIQGDITDSDTVYQYEFCKFKTTAEGITDFVDTRKFLDFDSFYAELRRDATNFFAQLEVQTEAEAELFIEDLRAMLQQLQKDMVPADLVSINNRNYESETLDGALTEIANKRKEIVTQLPLNWSGEGPYTQTIAANVKETDLVYVYPIYSDTLETRLLEKEEYNKLSLVKSGEGTITIICDEEAPTMALNIRLEVLR